MNDQMNTPGLNRMEDEEYPFDLKTLITSKKVLNVKEREFLLLKKNQGLDLIIGIKKSVKEIDRRLESK